MLQSLDCTARREALRRFLEEDVGLGDITTLALVSADQKAIGHFVAKMPLVVAGVQIAIETLTILDGGLVAEVWHGDGEYLSEGGRLAGVRGNARALLSGERVATNLLQRLSGVATLTKRFVDAVHGTDARILDTRKTTPGLRAFEKYAVTLGGGVNHRLGLDHAVLIKDNHVKIAGSIRAAIEAARSANSHTQQCEVEVTNLEELQEALACGVDAVLLDNMAPELVRKAVKLIRAQRTGREIVIEASGGMTVENVREFAEAGVDRISVGALTHSAPAIDVSFEIEPS